MRWFAFASFFVLALLACSPADHQERQVVEYGFQAALLDQSDDARQPFLTDKHVKNIDFFDHDDLRALHIHLNEEGAVVNKDVTSQHQGASIRIHLQGRVVASPRIVHPSSDEFVVTVEGHDWIKFFLAQINSGTGE